MEAHAGTITIGTGRAVKPRRRFFAELRASIRAQRAVRAQRAYSLRANGTRTDSIPGSEHVHLIQRSRGF